MFKINYSDDNSNKVYTSIMIAKDEADAQRSARVKFGKGLLEVIEVENPDDNEDE